MHRVDDDGVVKQGLHPRADVQLDHFEAPLGFVEAVEECKVFLAEGSEGHEPGVDETELFVSEGGGDAAAGGVATDYDVFYLEVLDCVLNDAEGVDVSEWCVRFDIRCPGVPDVESPLGMRWIPGRASGLTC